MEPQKWERFVKEAHDLKTTGVFEFGHFPDPLLRWWMCDCADFLYSRMFSPEKFISPNCCKAIWAARMYVCGSINRERLKKSRIEHGAKGQKESKPRQFLQGNQRLAEYYVFYAYQSCFVDVARASCTLINKKNLRELGTFTWNLKRLIYLCETYVACGDRVWLMLLREECPIEQPEDCALILTSSEIGNGCKKDTDSIWRFTRRG